METQKYWWQHPLADDIHQILREKEAQLPVYLTQSPQLSQRRYLVDWLAVVWEKYDLCHTARQLAVSLLDLFMDRFDIIDKQLHLVALGSLLIATKFEEQEANIPRSMDLNGYVTGPGFTSNEYLQMELLLLNFFDWKVSFPTPAHFTEHYMQLSQDENDTLNGKPIESFIRVLEHLRKYTNYFLEISLQDHLYRDFLPSLVGAACVAASRMCLHLSPVWSEKLQKVTFYTWMDLCPLLRAMQRTHQSDEQLQAARNTPPVTPISSTTCSCHISTSQSELAPHHTPTAICLPSPCYSVYTPNTGFCANMINNGGRFL